jgi:septal ring factor EnvC (AmiA/AmiB activator)
MTRGIRLLVLVLFSLVLVASLFVTGCSRNAKEEELQTLDETVASAGAAENQVAEKEQEKAALEAKLAEKQQELKDVKAEKEKVQAKLQ